MDYDYEYRPSEQSVRESETDKFINTIKMIGPLFSINSDIKIDFSHTDLKEILEHEHL